MTLPPLFPYSLAKFALGPLSMRYERNPGCYFSTNRQYCTVLYGRHTQVGCTKSPITEPQPSSPGHKHRLFYSFVLFFYPSTFAVKNKFFVYCTYFRTQGDESLHFWVNEASTSIDIRSHRQQALQESLLWFCFFTRWIVLRRLR